MYVCVCVCTCVCLFWSGEESKLNLLFSWMKKKKNSWSLPGISYASGLRMLVHCAFLSSSNCCDTFSLVCSPPDQKKKYSAEPALNVGSHPYCAKHQLMSVWPREPLSHFSNVHSIHWNFTAHSYLSVSDHTRHFSDWCDIYNAVKVVHGNHSDNHCNW